MGRIKDKDYNMAKETLELAGSKSAEKSHKKHTNKKGSPEDHGVSLLQEAQSEFQTMDMGQPNLVNGMTAPHHQALQRAAKKMDITWN